MDWTRILEVLEWIGFVVVLLTVVGVIGTIVAAIFFDWESGISLLLVGIVIISLGITISYYKYPILFEKKYLKFFPPKFVKCPYYGMNNLTTDVFYIKCGKVLPKKRRQNTQSR